MEEATTIIETCKNQQCMGMSDKKIFTSTRVCTVLRIQALFLIGFDIKSVNFHTTIIISPPYSNLEDYLGS